jgi:hypothetical protein
LNEEIRSLPSPFQLILTAVVFKFLWEGDVCHTFVSTKQKTRFKLNDMKTKNTLFALSFIATSFFGYSQAPLNIQVSTSNPTCFGLNDGEVIIDITGGTQPYIINGLEIAGTQFIAGTLAEGNYYFDVTDAASLMASADVTLVSPAELIVQAVVSNVSTYGGANGAIDITLLNGTGTFGWYTQNGSGVNSTMEDQSGLTEGIYTVAITEPNGCEISKRYVVSQPANPANTFNPNMNPNTQNGTTTGL